MKRKNSIQSQASKNPSVVLRAFAPETEFVMSLDGWMLLESMDIGLTRGERPTTRDLIIAMLVMTDIDAVFKAKRTRKLDALISEATEGRSVGDIMGYADKVTSAVEAAFEPSDTGTETEKKPSPDADGGSV